MGQGSILIVENNCAVFDRLGGYLQGCGYRVQRLTPAAALDGDGFERRWDAVLLGTPLPERDIADAMAGLRGAGVGAPVMVLANGGSVRDAVAVMQAGAADYFSVDEDQAIIEQCLSNLLKKNDLDNTTGIVPNGGPSLVGRSAAMASLLAMAVRVAASPATVLIQGESGTGKELLARFIHAQSGRGKHCLVGMNCAALPDTLAESELFGYERGAFTGAVQRKQGKFEQAHQGTLLLDEISEMPLPLQAKLLRVLQEKTVDRIGGRQPVPVDARVIATTNRDLAQMVRDGQFRQDLYYRLRIVPLAIPPLRVRVEDIPALADHFIRKHHGDDPAPMPRFSAAAMKQLAAWQWPGNVRELENTIQRAMLIRDGEEMGPELLLLEEGLGASGGGDAEALVGMTVKDLEERLIMQTLDHVNQNRTHAAELLGISIRTLRNKLREYRGDSA
ncbi:MAG: sigma-54-dependent Fis family transcriptional regulator [Desulfatitalea sp.]|nr:sigma-54-dependent Fis family transcriptional regulator [Desulfatitalea sp.]